MNIQQAKEEIRSTLRAYLQKDALGQYVYPPQRQRPLLLMGPPGVGKTAIMEQISRQEGVALVAYTMTHHTRQSAVGLPQIVRQTYGDTSFSVTEYTMSEIIGAVYAAMSRTGKREGILFLDEINCVSETLAPTMLQFLQNKTFGNHRLPEGWLIVAAGNPPEYNKSVRDFDIVTLDRIRTVNVEANVEVFLDYAAGQGVHGAVMSYLSLKPDRFYHVHRTENSLQFVTARGWEDLSRLLLSYEALDIPVHEELVSEFLNLEDTSRDFYAYYQLYRKYGTDYGVADILSGTADRAFYAAKTALAKAGDFTERITLTNLVLEQLRLSFREYHGLDLQTVALHEALAAYLHTPDSLDAFLEARRAAFDTRKKFGLVNFEERHRETAVLHRLDAMNLEAKQAHLHDRAALESFLKDAFGEEVQVREALVAALQQRLDIAFRFLTDCFGDGQELTLLLSGLTASVDAMDYIARHGCPAYTEASGRLLCQFNEQDLQQACRKALAAQSC